VLIILTKLKKAVLLVIDVQNDFCPGGTLEVKDGDGVVPVINRIMGEFPKVAATQDWHPQNHVSFASNHRGMSAFDSVSINGIDQVLWPDHCVQGTEGADLHPDLDKRYFDNILRKGTAPGLDSYSAFFENDKTTSTGIEYYLKGLGIEAVYVCGLATDFCVFYSVMDSVELGFKTTLIVDAARGVDFPEGSIEKAVANMRSAGVKVVKSEEVLTA